MIKIAFFNNKGGVGKTSLAYHLSWMFAETGKNTLAVDLDPQANLTGMFLQETSIEKIWEKESAGTIAASLEPLRKRTGDVKTPYVHRVSSRLGLILGDLSLSRFEDLLSENWPKAVDGDESAFRVLSSFNRIISQGGDQLQAELVLIDVGPNLGAINRTALLAADYVVVPLSPDLFSLQGLRNLGPTLNEWRKGWSKRLDNAPIDLDIPLPIGKMSPIGYVIMQHGIRDSRPVKAYQRWADQIPKVYKQAVLGETETWSSLLPEVNNELALLKHYRSLMPMAMEAHRPIFLLRSSDGAIGAHSEAVKDCYRDFFALAAKIEERILNS